MLACWHGVDADDVALYGNITRNYGNITVDQLPCGETTMKCKLSLQKKALNLNYYQGDEMFLSFALVSSLSPSVGE